MNKIIRLTKKIVRLCKKFGVKLTIKRGNKRVYKSKKVIMRQIKNKMKSKKSKKSRFGDCGCNKKSNGFGNTRKIRELRKICKIYGVKIGKKKTSVLVKQCRVKIKNKLKNLKKNKSQRFGLFDSKEVNQAKDQAKIREIEDPRLQKQNRGILKGSVQNLLNVGTFGILGESSEQYNKKEAERIAALMKQIKDNKEREEIRKKEEAIREEKRVRDEALREERRKKEEIIREENRVRDEALKERNRIREQELKEQNRIREQELKEKRIKEKAVQDERRKIEETFREERRTREEALNKEYRLREQEIKDQEKKRKESIEIAIAKSKEQEIIAKSNADALKNAQESKEISSTELNKKIEAAFVSKQIADQTKDVIKDLKDEHKELTQQAKDVVQTTFGKRRKYRH
jgi:trichohyalin